MPTGSATPRLPRAPRSARGPGACAAVALALLPAGCNRGSPPALFPLEDQVAIVGQPLVVQLVASDPDGDPLTYGFSGPAVPDLATTASIVVDPAGQGLFTFTPIASQLGLQVLDVWASDGREEDHQPLFVEVVQSGGEGTLPVFRSPLGAGTVLDLEQSDCLALDVEITDPDSATLVLDQAPPLIEGATLDAAPDGRTGTWSWCPSPRQLDTSDRYTLRLRADDGDNPPVTKEFVVVLRRRRGDGCPGQPPVVEHAPADAITRLDLPVVAEVSDDLGIGSQPYLVYATEDPGDPVDFSKTTLVPMELLAGDLRSGTWRGTITNALANAPEGTSSPLYYLVSVTDDDDAAGDCDHRTDDPSSGMHRITVTAGGSDVAGVCEPCSFDVQCGDEADLCLPTPAGGRCGQACSTSDECDEGTACSEGAVESVEGALGRQCVPTGGGCGSAGGCEDDDHEPDGTPAEATASAPLPDGSTGGRVLCGGDEDWFSLELDAPAQVTVSLDGDAPPDLDLSLTTAAGVLLDASEGLTSSEEVTAACLDQGTYLVRVYSIDAAPSGAYGLVLDRQACEAGGGDCCAAGDGPGCDDATVEACVCALDSFCCDTQWDDLCVTKATNDCGACGGAMGTGDGCCDAHATAGCSDPAIETCVCAADPFCCSTEWDAMCVSGVGTHACGSCPA